jgi:hypothetical protein
VTYLSALLLNRHPDTDGVRHAWSLQDCVDRWGVERRDMFVYPTEDETDVVELAPVREWYDPLITVKQAAARAKVTQRTVQRWIRDGEFDTVTRVRAGATIVTYVSAHTVDTVAERAREARHSGGRNTPRLAK